MFTLKNEHLRTEKIERGKEFFYNDRNIDKVWFILNPSAPIYSNDQEMQFGNEFKPVQTYPKDLGP